MTALKIDVVCKEVPVVTLDKDGDALAQFFYTNAAGMLQQCFASCNSADSLYSYVEDKIIDKECVEMGYRRDHIMIGKSIPSADGTPVYGVGTGGKRTTLFAMVVALALRKGKEYTLLQGYFDEYDKEKRYAYHFLSLLDGLQMKQKGNGLVPRIMVPAPPQQPNYAGPLQPSDAQRHTMMALRNEAYD